MTDAGTREWSRAGTRGRRNGGGYRYRSRHPVTPGGYSTAPSGVPVGFHPPPRGRCRVRCHPEQRPGSPLGAPWSGQRGRSGDPAQRPAPAVSGDACGDRGTLDRSWRRAGLGRDVTGATPGRAWVLGVKQLRLTPDPGLPRTSTGPAHVAGKPAGVPRPAGEGKPRSALRTRLALCATLNYI